MKKNPTIFVHTVSRPRYSLGRHEATDGNVSYVYYTGNYQHPRAGVTYIHWSPSIAWAVNIRDGKAYRLEITSGLSLKSFKWHVSYFIKHLYKS